MSGPALADLVSAGARQQDAVAINDHIFMSRGVSNCYLVATGSGALLVNTGLMHERGAPRPVRARVPSPSARSSSRRATASSSVAGRSSTLRASRRSSRSTSRRCAEREPARPVLRAAQPRLGRSRRRGRPAWCGLPGAAARPGADDDVRRHHSFALNDMRVELFSLRGGETIDSVVCLGARLTSRASPATCSARCTLTCRTSPPCAVISCAALRLDRDGRPGTRARAGAADDGAR